MTRLVLLTLVGAIFVIAAPVGSQTRAPSFVVVERGEGYDRLADAISAIGGGTGTIEIAPGLYRQCGVQEEGRITYRAREPGTVVFDGIACEGKAALVLRGRSAHLHGLIFQNIRVPDANGAGIRLEDGDLLVAETLFREGENGILVSNDHGGNIRIVQSTFSRLGACPEDQGCSHSIYNSGSGTMSVVRTRFERGTGGHYLKSRGRRIEVLESSFDDSEGHASNYMIDLSHGATGRIAGNLFVQGEDKENYSAFIMVAAEGADNSSDGLEVVNNEAEIVPGVDRATAFVADESGDRIRIADNRLQSQIQAFERR